MTDDPRKTRERIETLLRKALTLTRTLPQAESVQEAAAPYDPASSHYRVARYPYSRFYTYCISSSNSAIVLSYQWLPRSIQCGEAMARRRKSDGRGGRASGRVPRGCG
jgi:hypothetical protein